MLTTSFNRRIYLYSQPADMRKGFDGLGGIVRQYFNAIPSSGDLYVFINRRRDKIKILFWDGDGFVLYYKRLERGTFELPKATKNKVLELDRATLLMLIEGVEIKSIKRRKRWLQGA